MKPIICVTQCRAIFLTETDYQDHKITCPARLISDSTDHSSIHSSESADIEQLSDSSESDEETPLVSNSHYFGVPRPLSTQALSGALPIKQESPRKLSTSSESKISKPRRRHRGGRGKRNASNSSVTNDMRDEPDLLNLAAGALAKEGLSFGPYESDTDSDIEPNEDKSGAELNRLMSLNVMDDYDSDGSEGVESVMGDKASPIRSHASPIASGQTRARLEPVGVFWDIENCPVPENKSAFALAGKIRKEFFRGKREAEFMCVCDITKERKEVMDALNKAQV